MPLTRHVPPAVSTLPLSWLCPTQIPTVQFSFQLLTPSPTSHAAHLFIYARHRGDSQSRRYESKLSVTYREHPQRDSLPVVGEVAYPNLDFEYSKVGKKSEMTPRSGVGEGDKVKVMPQS